MILIPASIIIQFLLFNKIGKLNIAIAFFLSFYRSLVSFLYTTIFPLSDLTLNYVNLVKDCNFDIDNYTKNIFFHTSIANRIFCAFPKLSLSELNLFYSTFAALFIALFLSLLSDTRLSFNKNLDNNSFKNFNWLNKNLLYLFLFDPSIAIFSSAIGKDVFTFCFYISLIVLIIRFNLRNLICFIIVLLFINYSRAYVFLFTATALIVSYFLPDIKLIKSILPIRPKIKISSKIKTLFVTSLIGAICLFIYVLINYLSKVQIENLDYSSFEEAIKYFTISPQGKFAYPENTPLVIKYIFFWILPFPGVQTLASSFVFGYSTLLLLFLIYRIFSIGLILNQYFLKFIFSLTILVSVLFGTISNNSGLTVRYRTTSLLPAIFLIYHVTSNRYLSKIYYKDKEINSLKSYN